MDVPGILKQHDRDRNNQHHYKQQQQQHEQQYTEQQPTREGSLAMRRNDPDAAEQHELFKEGCAFEGAAIVALVAVEGGEDERDGGKTETKMEIVLEDGVMLTLDLDSGEKRLMQLGYEQTLQRSLTGFELYAAGLNCISVFAGFVPYYSIAYDNGGPVAVVWFWWITGIFANVMAVSLAEISSSFPLAGSMYFWAAALAPPRVRPFAAWITGWLEFMGASIGVGGTISAGISLLQDIVLIASEGSRKFTQVETFFWAVGMIALAGIINLLQVKTLGTLLAATAVYQIALGVVLIVCIPAIAPTLQPASWALGYYNSNLATTGLPNAAYSFVVSLLLSQYCLYAMDSAAHISEEAKRSDVTTPAAMVSSMGTVTVLAWGIMVALTFSIQSPENLAAGNTVTGDAQYVVQILWDVFYSRFGSGTGALVVLGLIYVSFFSCSCAQVMTAGRVAYALARDHGLPFSSVFRKVDSRKVPFPAIILTCSIAALSLLLLFAGSAAYYAVTGMATVGWFGAYAVPIAFRIAIPESEFVPGPFYMGSYIGVAGGKAIHSVALLYVLYTIAVFMLPTVYPITSANFNYSPVGIAIVVVFFMTIWVLDAHRWFRGPYVRGSNESTTATPKATSVGAGTADVAPKQSFLSHLFQ